MARPRRARSGRRPFKRALDTFSPKHYGFTIYGFSLSPTKMAGSSALTACVDANAEGRLGNKHAAAHRAQQAGAFGLSLRTPSGSGWA
eukprot:scaffold17253_cov124-Isochrysis_galbana.AAC.1